MSRRRDTKPDQIDIDGTKTVLFLAAPQTQILDVAGPFQVFVRACELNARAAPAAPPAYRVLLASSVPHKIVQTNCGLGLVASHYYRSVPRKIDTFLVAGGSGLDQAANDRHLLAWIRRTASGARRSGSVCTGAFLLAAAGLLDGKRVTTHWKWAAELAQRFCKITVDPDPIFVRDGNMYTTAGITAGMDLALALVEEDLGTRVALQVAREMVLYLRRPGGQSQFSAALALQASDAKPIGDLHTWVRNHLDGDLSVAALARRVAMSPRSFARNFVAQVQTTPARYVERMRIEMARQRLEQSNDNVGKIALDCGLGTAETMRRAFLKMLCVTPTDYRARFCSGPATRRKR